LARFKVAKGGRGKGASWAIADRLLDKAHTQPSLILCTREVQNSIADSVHRLLSNRIRSLGYSEFFSITAGSIKNIVTGSEFLFRGLNDLTVDTVKSMEGITDVWLAEAHNVGAKSWLVLEPTIRTDGSTIWVDYNPDEEDAPTNVKFTKEAPDNAIVRHLTFEDNPFFPEVLEKLRQQSLDRIRKAQNDDAREQAQLDYNHVWLGHTRKASKASIFGARFHVEKFEPHVDAGGWDGPYDGADWGFGSDPTTRTRSWIWTHPNGRRYLAVEREAYLRGADGMALQLRDLPKAFDEFPNSRTTLIMADNSQPQTIGYMQNQGFKIKGADKWNGSVEDGIQHILGAYDGIIVHPRCPMTAEEMKLYSYKTDRLTGEVLADIVDDWNHAIDSIRYSLGGLIQRKRGGHLFAK
jgi:phage terminase large subunit